MLINSIQQAFIYTFCTVSALGALPDFLFFCFIIFCNNIKNILIIALCHK